MLLIVLGLASFGAVGNIGFWIIIIRNPGWRKKWLIAGLACITACSFTALGIGSSKL